MTTIIIDCTCKHPMQDKLYGTGKRVANAKHKGGDIAGYRCTVCAKEYDLSMAKEK